MKMSLATIALLVATTLWTGHARAQSPDNPQTDDPFAAFGAEGSQQSREATPAVEHAHAEAASFTERLEKKLHEESDVQIGTVPMSEFVVELGKAIEAPVFFQPHPEWTDVNESTSISLETSGLPLGVELKKALRPHGLRAIVHDDALMIVADTVELARRGIGTEQYVSLDDSSMRALEEKLAQPYSQNFNGIPLQDAVRIISEETKIQFVIDTRALEDLGLTRDVPITIDLADVTVYEFLQFMLRDSDLTLHPREGYVMVTTVEEAEDPVNQISRVYWLDGTGLSIDAAAEAIESTIDPDTWEALGGPSSTAGMDANEHGRKTLVIMAPYAVHREVAKLLQTVRQGVVDPRAAYIDAPSTKGYYGPGSHGPTAPMGGMGMGMGGMAPGGGKTAP